MAAAPASQNTQLDSVRLHLFLEYPYPPRRFLYARDKDPDDVRRNAREEAHEAEEEGDNVENAEKHGPPRAEAAVSNRIRIALTQGSGDAS